MNIRQKIFSSLLASLVSIGVIGGISFYNLFVVKDKVIVIERVDDFSNIILEARRYEKNYLLYGKEEDFDESIHYVDRGVALLRNVHSNISDPESRRQIGAIEEMIIYYRQGMENIRQTPNPVLLENLREMGKHLVDEAIKLSAHERVKIIHIIRWLKVSIVCSAIVLVGVGLLLLNFINSRVIRPLRSIEKATNDIAQGKFTPLANHQSHDEISRLVDALNHMVTELERRQEQLIQAHKLSSIGTLSSGIAHQLNNPLNNISTSSQILTEEVGDQLSDFGRKMLGNITQETLRARDIVRGLLEFSRHQDYTPRTIKLSEVVDRSVSLISSQVPAGIAIETDVPPDLEVTIDRQGMQEVFINLLLNAVQAIERTPGRVSVSARFDEDKQSVGVLVKDTGKGMPEGVRKQVFDPFFTTKDMRGGTGLGLFIVFSIVKKNRGTVEVDSSEGVGTTFTITLPVKPLDSDLQAG